MQLLHFNLNFVTFAKSLFRYINFKLQKPVPIWIAEFFKGNRKILRPMAKFSASDLHKLEYIRD